MTAIFGFGTEAWLRVLRAIRREFYAEAVRSDVDMVATAAIRDSATATVIHQEVLAPVFDGGGQVLLVRLICDRDELLRRLQSESRQGRKLTNPDVMLSMYDLDAMLPFEPQLRLDNTSLEPGEAARRIAEHFSLPSSIRP